MLIPGIAPSLLGLLLFLGLGCGEASSPPLSGEGDDQPVSAPEEKNGIALGSVSIAVTFPPDLALTPARIELEVTGTDTSNLSKERLLYNGAPTEKLAIPAGRNRLFVLKGYDAADELVSTGAAETDIIAGEQIDLEVALWPLSQSLSLVFGGIGDAFSERFVLKEQVPYIFRIRYVEQIAVELINSLSGAKGEVVLEEAGISAETVRTIRIIQLDTTAEFFLHARNTSKLWRIDIEGY